MARHICPGGCPPLLGQELSGHPAMCKCNQQSNQLTSHVSGGGMEFPFLGTKVRAPAVWVQAGTVKQTDLQDLQK